MKRILDILIISSLFLFFSTKGYSQIFYVNKDLDFEKLVNFDLSKYTFEDYEKILGSNVEVWDGNPDYKGSRELDWRKINIKIKGSTHKLKLSKLKDNQIKLSIFIYQVRCSDAVKLIPSKFFSKENYLEYETDFEIMKNKIIKLSYDTKNQTRLSFGCMENTDPDGNFKSFSEYDPTSVISLTSINDAVYKNIVPLKMISCKIEKGRINNDVNYTVLQDSIYTNFYISDGEDRLLDEKKITAGDNKTFSKDKIHTVETHNFKKAEVQDAINYFNEYKIDRINASFYHKLKRYGPRYKDYPNMEIQLEYLGTCEKKEVEERAF